MRSRYAGYVTDKRCRLNRRAQMEADPSDPKHGTTTGYQYGCRCERCRAVGKDPRVHGRGPRHGV